MRAVRSLPRVVLVALLTLGVASLAASARAADPDVINLINLPADNSAEVYYAEDLGFFKAANLDVRITAMTNTAAIVAAIAGGAGDVGNAVVGAVSAARARGIPVRFIAPAGLYLDASPTSALVVPIDSPLHTAADLTGKTVAVSGLNDLTYYATRAWIDKNGGNSAAVNYVELPFPAMPAALQAHRVDAAYDIEPFMTAGKASLRILGRAGSGVALRYLATGWVANDAWIQSHVDVARRFSAVMRRTAEWANAHHQESAAILLRYTKIPPEVAASMNRVEYALALTPALLQPPIDVAAKYGGVKAIPAAEVMWTPPR